MGTPDEIELRIQDELRSIAQSLDKRLDRECTIEVMKVLETLGSGLGCEVRSSGTEQHENGEWLFDMTWRRLQDHDHALLDLELIAESEWKPEGVQEDFQKLLAGRARHRLMIYSQKTKTLARTAPDRLIAEIQNFRLTQPADRYLFAVWHNEGAKFEFRVYVHA